jgi:hypothetical protein
MAAGKAAKSASLVALAGGSLPMLPGESQDEYSQGLAELQTELQASTLFETYLVQKMFDCVWWVRRFDRMRASVITDGIYDALSYAHQSDEMLRLIQAGQWDAEELEMAARFLNTTVDGLVALATNQNRHRLAKIDQQITDRLKMLKDLQKAYDQHVNRAFVRERMALQNQMLEQQLTAIDVTPE